jgi:glycosyltransferase involved in cell wall biosynthesis
LERAVSEPINIRLKNAFGTSAADQLMIPDEGVVAVILAYNEALRFPDFLRHYRSIGIRHFIVVDNNSDDDTSTLLADQPDISVISTENAYKDHKSVWRQLLCERYLHERWVVFPDVDELFVYPGWPELRVDKLVDYLDEYKYRALFCAMVDMYPEGPLEKLSYHQGDRFLETCPFFDASGYRYNPLKGSHQKRDKSPVRHIFGGTRERVFHQNSKRPKNLLDKLLLRNFFGIQSRSPETGFGRKVDHMLFKLVKNALPDTAAVQSKIPLIKWDIGYKFSGGVHGIDKKLEFAPDWGALLHFKYLEDFQSKVAEAIERKQHTDNAGHYRDYSSQMGRLMEEGLLHSGSVRFTGTKSLIDCGLMRESNAIMQVSGQEK